MTSFCLQEDNRAPAWVDAGRKKLDRSASWQRKALDQDIVLCADEIAVVSGIEKQQHEIVGTTIAQFQREATLQRLAIPWSCLSLDADRPRAAGDNCIPGPSVRRARKRHFGSEPQRTMKKGPKATQECCVSDVPERLARRKCPGAQLQTHCCKQARSLLDRQIGRQASLDPAVLRLRESHGMSDHLTAETPVQSSAVDLVQELARERSASSRCDVDVPGSAAHDASLPGWPYARVIETGVPSARA